MGPVHGLPVYGLPVYGLPVYGLSGIYGRLMSSADISCPT